MSRLKLTYEGPTLFTHEIPVRITDLNYGNHLAHDTLVSLLHEARARFFSFHDMSEKDVDGAGIILVDLAVRYQAQGFYGQVMVIEIGVVDVGSRGCTLEYRVTEKEQGTPVALARTGIVFFDYGAQKVVGMPDRFRVVLDGPNLA